MPLKYGCLFLFCASLLSAKEAEWLRITSPHFELLTNASEKQGREAIQYFEQIRDLFSRLMGEGALTKLPIRLVGFRNEKDYRPYAPTAAAAWYIGDEARDYIVMGNLSGEVFPIAVHEYMHLLIRHSRLKMPVWLNEGFAEVYSTVQPFGGKLRIGMVPAGRAAELAYGKLMPIERLLQVRHDSPEYNEKDKKGALYAQAWMLVHMLYLHNDFRPKFGQFVETVSRTEDSVGAFQSVYGLNVEQVSKAFEGYRRASSINVAIFDGKLEKPSEAPVIESAGKLQTGVVLAELKTLLRKHDEARTAYAELAQEFPNEAITQEGLALLEWRTRNTEQALVHFEKAVELGCKNADFLWTYARVLRRNQPESPKLQLLLEKLLMVDPANLDARFMLADHLIRRQRWPQVLAALSTVKQVNSEQAEFLFQAQAHAYLKLEMLKQARERATLLEKYGKSDQAKMTAKQMLSYLNQRDEHEAQLKERQARMAEQAKNSAQSKNSEAHEDVETPRLARTRPSSGADVPLAELPAAFGEEPQENLFSMAGTMKHLDCEGAQAVLHVQVGSQVVRFRIDDPKAVQVEGTHTLDLQCGAQKGQQVLVKYKSQGKTSGMLGDLRGLEFRK
jgi:tetratricopeptide (TPR) repeat protein